VVSEKICLATIESLYGRRVVLTQRFEAQDADNSTSRTSSDDNALTEPQLVRPLLTHYELADVEVAIRWLQLGGYISRVQFGLGGPWAHKLSDKGVQVAEDGRFSDEERALFYRIDPYAIFLAHQFTAADAGLERAIREHLTATGYAVVDGRVDGLEPFRHAILRKIATSRFFLCLLTHRSELAEGGFVSSVWLYQEIGAAVASGKSPLLLVESGMDPHYAGELQKTYEYIGIERECFVDVLPEVVRRFNVDLERDAIPVPNGSPAGTV